MRNVVLGSVPVVTAIAYLATVNACLGCLVLRVTSRVLPTHGAQTASNSATALQNSLLAVTQLYAHIFILIYLLMLLTSVKFVIQTMFLNIDMVPFKLTECCKLFILFV